MRAVLLSWRLTVLLAILALTEVVGSGPRGIEWWMENIRRAAERRPSTLNFSIPAAWADSGRNEHGLPVPTFSQIKAEFDLLGYDCVEVQRGNEKELYEAKLITIHDVNRSLEVVVGTFRLRDDPA